MRIGSFAQFVADHYKARLRAAARLAGLMLHKWHLPVNNYDVCWFTECGFPARPDKIPMQKYLYTTSE
jgi:hypothetical protein